MEFETNYPKSPEHLDFLNKRDTLIYSKKLDIQAFEKVIFIKDTKKFRISIKSKVVDNFVFYNIDIEYTIDGLRHLDVVYESANIAEIISKFNDIYDAHILYEKHTKLLWQTLIDKITYAKLTDEIPCGVDLFYYETLEKYFSDLNSYMDKCVYINDVLVLVSLRHIFSLSEDFIKKITYIGESEYTLYDYLQAYTQHKYGMDISLSVINDTTMEIYKSITKGTNNEIYLTDDI